MGKVGKVWIWATFQFSQVHGKVLDCTPKHKVNTFQPALKDLINKQKMYLFRIIYKLGILPCRIPNNLYKTYPHRAWTIISDLLPIVIVCNRDWGQPYSGNPKQYYLKCKVKVNINSEKAHKQHISLMWYAVVFLPQSLKHNLKIHQINSTQMVFYKIPQSFQGHKNLHKFEKLSQPDMPKETPLTVELSSRILYSLSSGISKISISTFFLHRSTKSK